MKIFSKITLVFGFCCIILLSSCLKPESYPIEPVLSDAYFVDNGDSTGVVTVTFTDGDGDIGLREKDTVDPYSPGTYFYYNYYLEYYEYMNGNWVRGTADPNGNNFPTADPVTFAFRLEDITPEGKNKALKGQISVTLEPYYFNTNSESSDSIKYAITLIDKAQNISNTIETDPIIR